VVYSPLFWISDIFYYMKEKLLYRILDYGLFALFMALLALNIIGLTLANLSYNGEFDLLDYPFSYLGMTKTLEGLSNTKALIFYDIDMILSGTMMLLIALYFLQKEELKSNTNKAVISAICGLGFIVAVSPDDTMHSLHVIGSATFVASLWILSMIFLREIKNKLSKVKYYFFWSILQIPIISYAISVFLDKPYDGFLQKFALIGLLVTLIYSTRRLSVN